MRVSGVKILKLWGIVLLVYVLWPGREQLWWRLSGIPVEYVPPLVVMIISAFASFIGTGGVAPLRLPRALFTIVVAFLGYIALSVLWSVDVGLWAMRFLMWVIYLLSFGAVASAIAGLEPEKLLSFLEWNIVTSALFALIGLVKAFAMGMLGTLPHYSTLIRYSYIEGLVMFAALPMCAFLYNFRRRPRYPLLATVLVLGSLLTYSRVAMIGAIGSLIGLGLNRGTRRFAVVVGAFALVSGVALALAGAGSSLSPVRLSERLSQVRMVRFIWTGDVASLASYNPDDLAGFVWFREALRIAREHPLLGTGLGNYEMYYELLDEFAEPTRARNFYASYWAEVGLVGLALLTAFLVTLAYIPWQISRHFAASRWARGAEAFAVQQLVFFVLLAGEEFVSTPYVWYYWAINLGVALFFIRQSAKGDHRLEARPSCELRREGPRGPASTSVAETTVGL